MFVYPESHFFSLEKSEIHMVIGRKVNSFLLILSVVMKITKHVTTLHISSNEK